MYATPHAWTPFAEEVRGRRVVQRDQAKWDYRHQVLAHDKLRPWQLFLAVKWLELCFHLTPRRLWSILRAGGRARRHQRSWVFRHIALVWVAEVIEFVRGTSFARTPVTLAELESPRRALRSRSTIS
jgi:anaerobic magnesium-protoporphyrin IX monomethyl ester cyclase